MESQHSPSPGSFALPESTCRGESLLVKAIALALSVCTCCRVKLPKLLAISNLVGQLALETLLRFDQVLF
jgi:hypothetical protein